MLHERSFADLSVSTISERAGVARSGFYFYFDSKYAVLAVILADASDLLDSLTHHFASREPGETPAAFAKRMVGSAAAVYANDDPVLKACAVARNTDAQIREMMDDFYDGIIDKLDRPARAGLRGASPISDDLPALVRTLAATTTMTLTQDSAFVGRGDDPDRAVDALERLWVSAIWGGSRPRSRSRSVRSPPWRRAALTASVVFSDRGRQRHRPRDRAEAGRRRAPNSYLTDRDAEGLARRSPTPARWAPRCPSTAPRHLRLRRGDRFAADIHADHPAMDVVMNIAGVSAWGTVDRLTHEHWKSMIDINLMGPIHVIEAFVPPMVEARRGGHLVNVSSAAGLVALPWHAAYSASKYGLRGLSEVLRFDLARHRIGVSVVVPGAVKTPLVQTVQIAGVDREDPSVQKWTDRFAGHAVSPGTRRRPDPARRRQEPVS